MPRHSRSRRHSSTQGIHHIVDEIVSEVSDALKDAESNIRREWSWARDGWQKSRTVRDFKSMKDKLNEVPDRLNDLATDGSCFVQYVFAYSFKAVAVIMMVAGLIAAGDRFSDTPMETENIVAGLSLLVGGQFGFWFGHLIQKSADRKRDAKDQNRLLRLARSRGGSLTVLETATDLRLTVDKTEEMMRELAARGHAEVRVSKSGLLVYHFAEIEYESEKGGARPVDEFVEGEVIDGRADNNQCDGRHDRVGLSGPQVCRP
ncbi:MAG: hypothetical protein CME19_13530 [Gemmatimonadetes bacterium]|nr:hypothetical protein [Gemmatimonadota bacterium]|tara:strand:- start:1808 stop:2590 length:783 start_codon:yes stop_codon:yes gene_type:complete